MQLLGKFADFSKGHAGWVDKAEMPPGFFLGEQVVAYRGGSVGPRAGLLDLGVTGLPGGSPTVYGLGYVHNVVSAANDYVWIWTNTAIGKFPVYDVNGKLLLGQAYAAVTGAFAAVPVGTALGYHVEYSPNVTIFQVDGDKTYYVDWAANTLNAIAASKPGAHCEIYDGLLLVDGGSANPNRIWWSALGDFTSWPATNFIDLSGGLGGTASNLPKITCMKRMRDMLVVWTSHGQVYLITSISVDAATWRVRELVPGDSGSGPRGLSVLRDHSGILYYTRRAPMTQPGEELYDAASAVPVSFDGTSRAEFLEQGGWLRQPNSFQSDSISRVTGITGREEKSFALAGTQGRALVMRNGAWSRHRFNPNINGQIVASGQRGEMFGVDSPLTKVYGWQMELERPPWHNQGSTVATLPTSDADAGGAMSPLPWLALPVIREPSGDHIVVKRVEVLLTSWDTGGSLHNHLDVSVQQYDGLDANELTDTGSFFPPDSQGAGGAMVAGHPTVGCSNSFDEAPPALSHRRRVAFYPLVDNLPAQSVRILLHGWQGVSVREVHVYGDIVKDPRP